MHYINENEFDAKALKEMTSEPLESQYHRIRTNISCAIIATNEEISISFSGGKDSALVLDMYCELISHIRIVGHEIKPIKVVWANTTNETVAMNRYVPWFIKRCEEKYGVKIDFTEARPKNGDNIVTVIRREGIPFVSKFVAERLRKVRKNMDECGVDYNDIKHLHHPTVECRDALREMGLNNTTILALTGWSRRRNDFGVEFVLPAKWMPLLNIQQETGKNIRFSEKCCDILKKGPMSQIERPRIMTGEQAVESRARAAAWMKTGCNYLMPDGGYKSKPLGPVSFDAVLYAIHKRKIPLCPDYGEVVFDCENNCYTCTKAQRTGCALCGFGIKFDPERFVRLQKTDEAKVDFAFRPLEQGGLGYRELCEYANEYCGTKIIIPT